MKALTKNMKQTAVITISFYFIKKAFLLSLCRQFLFEKFYSGASAREARSDAPYLRKIGKPSSRENLVMTSAYERESERASERTPSVQTLGVEEGRLVIRLTGDLRNALGGNCQKRLICICYVDKRSGTLI